MTTSSPVEYLLSFTSQFDNTKGCFFSVMFDSFSCIFLSKQMNRALVFPSYILPLDFPFLLSFSGDISVITP